MQYPEYSHQTCECAACGYRQAAPTRCTPWGTPFAIKFVRIRDGEKPHLRRTCPNCGYEWKEECIGPIAQPWVEGTGSLEPAAAYGMIYTCECGWDSRYSTCPWVGDKCPLCGRKTKVVHPAPVDPTTR